MRAAGTLLAIIAVLVAASALFAQVMARITGLQLPATASSSPAVSMPAAAVAVTSGSATTATTATETTVTSARARREGGAASSDAPTVVALDPPPMSIAAPDIALAARNADLKALPRPSQPANRRNAPRRAEAAVPSPPNLPIVVAMAPTPEQLRVAQCRTLLGYESELAAQIAASAAAVGNAATEAPSLSGLREQLAITRARRLELGC